ncbi:39S ribosomal protein L33, mitochondrial [Anthonomus grandis grandis]|uniref:39S ribosomal protein L33, mitochondrial n=1 Tax=Anthonomus grandis grandis TaxID=2921223 RepID=UPI0021659194|nr:39S ribosomal protein L33, mitochondrial [Anthonomus grandis grandis]XP_050303037.1 39S ribosomal protein L33, mitochondrial [Anthonomus grandis grandis]
MFLTRTLLKKVKAKDIMVRMESLVSGHTFNKIRPRLADKLEVIRFDPRIQKECVYREKKKVRSM